MELLVKFREVQTTLVNTRTRTLGTSDMNMQPSLRERGEGKKPALVVQKSKDG